MNKQLTYLLLRCFLIVNLASSSQNETKKWYFGDHAGLDFMTNPPTALTNGVLSTLEGCSSVADVSGNLLFYTDGMTVWNQLHAVMANGTGLFGDVSTTQSALIVKQPGNSNIYFVFTADAYGGMNGLRYSIVDMALAAGMGSVTSKNILIHTPSTERIAAVKHCNGTDVWIVSHDWNSGNFRANLVTSAGVNTSAVISSIGSFHGNLNALFLGYLKFSPNGKKLAIALTYNVPSSTYEIYDFDNATGVISNVLGLGATYHTYGCEFSPDGTKFYGSDADDSFQLSVFSNLYQWDLCAGTDSAIIASKYTVFAGFGFLKGALQLGPDGKIYVAKYTAQNLGVITNPNAPGILCSYTDVGQSLSTGTCTFGLPNFISEVSPIPFTYTLHCQTVSFASPVTPNSTLTSCFASGDPVLNILWNFGDPTSGSSNISLAIQPVHAFTAPGTYTVSLILNYDCRTDTLTQVITTDQSCISLTSSVTCAGLGSATVAATTGNGPFSYTWTPTGQTNSVATNLIPGTYTIAVHDAGINLTYTAITTLTSLVSLSGTLNTNSLTCIGDNNGTASITNITGGSSNQTYLWSNGVISYTTPFVTGLSTGSWSVTVTDVLTGCVMTQSFYISQPPPLTLTVTPGIAGICPGGNIDLIASGTGSSYTWTPSAGLNTITGPTVSANPASQQIYTVTTSVNSCTNTASATVTVSILPAPGASVAISKQRVCLNEWVTLQGSGGQSYNWAGPADLLDTGQSVSFVASHVAYTGIYTLSVAHVNGCTATATVSIIVNDLPQASLLGTRMEGCIPFCSDFKFYSATNTSSQVTASWEIDRQVFTSKSFSYCFSDPDNYIITGNLTDTVNNCRNTTTLIVKAYPIPVADFIYSPTRPVEGLETVIFTNSSTGENQSSWSWFFISNDGYRSSGENTSYFFRDAGVYPVALIVKNIWGCTDSIVKVVQIESDFTIYVPNVFSPNGDGRNDLFLPILRGAKFYELSVFNRWGTGIFETNDVLMGWDGTFKGEDCKNDVYVWKINVSGLNGETKEVTGHVTLNR